LKLKRLRNLYTSQQTITISEIPNYEKIFSDYSISSTKKDENGLIIYFNLIDIDEDKDINIQNITINKKYEKNLTDTEKNNYDYEKNSAILILRNSTSGQQARILSKYLNIKTKGYGIPFLYGNDLQKNISYNKLKRFVDKFTIFGFYLHNSTININGDNSPFYYNLMEFSSIQLKNTEIFSTGKNSPLIYAKKNWHKFMLSNVLINVNSQITNVENAILSLRYGNSKGNYYIKTNSTPTLSSKKDACAFYFFNSLSYFKDNYNSNQLFLHANISVDSNSPYYTCAPLIYVNSARLHGDFFYNHAYEFGSEVLMRIENHSYVSFSFFNNTDEDKPYNIYIDETSQFNLYIESGTYTGSINKENLAKKVKVKIFENGKLKLTGNSYISELENNGIIEYGDYKIYNATGFGSDEEDFSFCDVRCNKLFAKLENKNENISYEYNYINNNNNSSIFYFNISFTKKLDKLYSIYALYKNSKNEYKKIENCNFYDENQKIITCPVAEDIFALNINSSKKMTYKIYIENNCEEKYYTNLNIIVYKERANYITFKKIIFPSKCSNFPKDTEIKIYGKNSDIDKFGEFDLNDTLYLINEEENNNYEKIPLNCHIQKNDDYSINYEIKMKCIVKETVKKVPSRLKLITTNEIIKINVTNYINYINPINIKTKTEKYNQNYLSINKSEKLIKIYNNNNEDEEEEEDSKYIEIYFEQEINYLPTLFVYSKYTNNNETLNCTKSSQYSVTWEINKSLFMLNDNKILYNIYKLYMKNICGEIENTNINIKLYDDGYKLNINLIALFALLILF